MLLILGIIIYLILTVFTIAVYNTNGFPINRNKPLKTKVIKLFLLITIGWLVTLFTTVGMVLGCIGVFLFERIIDYFEDSWDEDYD